MGTIEKRFVFTTTIENLAKVSGDAGVAAAFDSANGVNVDGAVSGAGDGNTDLSGTTAGANPDVIFRQSVSTTWEDWGVPPGATVTAVYLGRYWFVHWSTAGSSYRHRMRVVDSGGTSVTSVAGDLVDSTPSLTPTGLPFRSGTGNRRAVDTGKQVSTTVVKLEVEISGTLTSGSSFDIAFDSIVLAIEYTDVVGAERAVSVHKPLVGRSL